MGDVVNLNRYRKQKEREEKARTAASNRSKHGVSKADRQRLDAGRSKSATLLDGHRLDRDKPAGGQPQGHPKGPPPKGTGGAG